ncbi:MAG: phenylalanine--tRNA ligase subunit alpha [Acidobacteria bacterium]|nr:phenylalanine--tRNA ligase subunit alpha [Acidobacteriota bacterium]
MAAGDETPGRLAWLEEERALFDEELARVTSLAEWEGLRLRWVGKKKGRVRQHLKALREVPGSDRAVLGQAVNGLKRRVESGLSRRKAMLETEEQIGSPSAAVDVTLPGRPPSVGSLHPVSIITQEIVEIFKAMGYSVAEGPEVEDDYHNFEALNFPPDHPARDTQDTFFVDDGRLLRTHTSPVQIRTILERAAPPIRVICAGRVYRNDNDLRHSPMFHQVECLVVDKGITFGHLKGTLEAFVQQLFHPDTGVRLRPSFFPFTEPSAEVDITCPFCQGDGCRTCSDSGWMEILGSGMVDPRVLAGCGIDPEIYSGFAFGLGLDRVAMIRFGIPNIRQLFDNDERLLRQVKG